MIQTITKDKIQFQFDPKVEPAAFANSGDTVCFDCQDCYAEQLTEDRMEFSRMDMTRNNPITGPLFVNGAEPGDVLKVEILKIDLEDHGVMCVRTGKGIYEVDGCFCRRFDIEDGIIHWDRGLDIPVRPMIGVIGTCPTEPESTQVPGNMEEIWIFVNWVKERSFTYRYLCREQIFPWPIFMQFRAMAKLLSAVWNAAEKLPCE